MPARRWPTSCLGLSGMACDDGTVTVSVELAPGTARVASEQAARAGVSLGEYVRALVAGEVERRRPWRFEIEFDEGRTATHGTTVDELYDRVGAFVEPYGNVRVARGTWQAREGAASGAGAPGAGALGHAERQSHNVLRERHRGGLPRCGPQGLAAAHLRLERKKPALPE